MDPKRSLTKPKADKKLNTKRSDSQISLPSLTEPNQPYKETSRYSELPRNPTERTSVDTIKRQKTKKEKEACALDYLRRMSDDESSYDIERKMTNLEDEFDPLDDSNRLSPFMNSTKRHSNQQTQNTMFNPNSTQTKFEKKVKKVRRKTEKVTRKEAAKRVLSEPNERTSTRNIKNQFDQFVFYEPPPKGTVSKVNIGTELIEEPHQLHFRRSSSIYEKFNAMTEPDYYDITAVINEPKLKEKEIAVNVENPKAPPVLQVRRLVGQNYSRILQGMREYRDTGVLRDMKSIIRGKQGRQETESHSSRKAYYSKEKKPPAGMPNSFRYGPSGIVMVGRSVSVPKFPGEFEHYVDHEFNTKKLSIEDTRERRRTSLSDHNNSKDLLPYKEELLKGVRSISSAGTSRRNFRGDSDFDTRPFSRAFSKDQDLKNFFYEDQNQKEEDVIFIPKAIPVNDSLSTLPEDRVITTVEDSKDIQELKVGFWFKAKKSMLNPPAPAPKKEAPVQPKEKPPAIGLNHRRPQRETCKENKVLLDKVSEVYKFKMGVINPQQPKQQTNKNPLGHPKPPLNIKDLNFPIRDARLANPANKQNSFREAYSIDLKGLEGKAPKLKAILNVLNKELKPERSASPLRKSSIHSHENKSIKNIHSARKGSDVLADFLNMKGAGMRLKTSRFDE